MTDAEITASTSNKRTILIGLAAAIVLGVLVGAIYWTTVCPCERTPGAILFGEVQEEPVSNWSFANQVELCQIQIHAGWRPHAINLNCMAADTGELYLSCSACATKYWASKVLDDPRGRLRLNGIVYPVTLTRITAPTEMDRSWRARLQKLALVGGPGNPAPPLTTPRDEGWWTFRVQSST